MRCMVKVELHAHTSDDPAERVPHTTFALIDLAVELGYHALAITLHDKQLDLGPFVSYATGRGLVLIPGVERAVRQKHVLLINFPPQAERVESFEEIAQLKARSRGLVIAPHPFYPTPASLYGLIDCHAGLFDAVELNALYTRQLNFNSAAVRWAERHGRPLVGNCDVHRLMQLGTTFSLIDSEADADSICDAIRAGRVEVKTEPLTWPRAVATYAKMLMGNVLKPRPVATAQCPL